MSEQQNYIPTPVISEPVTVMRNAYDEILTRMAIEEINKNIAKKATLAEEVGPSGWRQPLPFKTNKRFLQNTIRNAINHNTRKSNKRRELSLKKLHETYTKPERAPAQKYIPPPNDEVICID